MPTLYGNFKLEAGWWGGFPRRTHSLHMLSHSRTCLAAGEPPVAVPGACLFTECLRVESGENDETVEARVRLKLEAIAPLPLTRLAWGWVRVGEVALIYASSRERLAAAGIRVDASAGEPCLPDFSGAKLPSGISPEALAVALRHRYSDMRDRVVLGALAEAERTESALLWVRRVTRGLAIAGAALFVLGLGLFGFAAWRTGTCERRAAHIAEIEARAELAAELSQSARGAGGAYELLAAVNAHRPDPVTLTRCEWEGDALMRVAGVSESVAQVNRFVTALRVTGLFGAVDAERMETAGGKTNFRLKLTVVRRPVMRASSFAKKEVSGA